MWEISVIFFETDQLWVPEIKIFSIQPTTLVIDNHCSIKKNK